MLISLFSPSQMKRYYFFIIIFFLLTIVRAGTSESEVIVSLKAELSDESTSEDKLRIFNDLAWEYHTSNFDSADHYVEKALALAKATKNINWQAVSMEMK